MRFNGINLDTAILFSFTHLQLSLALLFNYFACKTLLARVPSNVRYIINDSSRTKRRYFGRMATDKERTGFIYLDHVYNEL